MSPIHVEKSNVLYSLELYHLETGQNSIDEKLYTEFIVHKKITKSGQKFKMCNFQHVFLTCRKMMPDSSQPLADVYAEIVNYTNARRRMNDLLGAASMSLKDYNIGRFEEVDNYIGNNTCLLPANKDRNAKIIVDNYVKHPKVMQALGLPRKKELESSRYSVTISSFIDATREESPPIYKLNNLIAKKTATPAEYYSYTGHTFNIDAYEACRPNVTTQGLARSAFIAGQARGFVEMVRFCASTDVMPRENRDGKIQSLEMELSTYRKSIEEARRRGGIDDESYFLFIAQTRPPLRELSAHFKNKLLTRFGLIISQEELDFINGEITEDDIIGYSTSTGSPFIRVCIQGKEVYIIITRSKRGDWAASTAYTHDMYIEDQRRGMRDGARDSKNRRKKKAAKRNIRAKR